MGAPAHPRPDVRGLQDRWLLGDRLVAMGSSGALETSLAPLIVRCGVGRPSGLEPLTPGATVQRAKLCTARQFRDSGCCVAGRTAAEGDASGRVAHSVEHGAGLAARLDSRARP